MSAFKSLGEIAFYSPLVIAARMGILAGTGAARDREASRMVTEKLAAASVAGVHSALEMQKQAALAMLAFSAGRKPQPARAAEKVAGAALKPVARKVKANSRRLSKRGRP
jgi:hypothetical protein